jgi:NAD(P)-dependent dehydrogenase (short-subunit alcohol dehydrogenase family)
MTGVVMKDFRGKVVFIAGGASGAGLGQAKVFSEVGCKVVIADIRQDHLDEAMKYFREKKAQVHAIRLDITDRKAYTAAADEVEKVYGSPPQLLLNTAGVNAFRPAETSTYEDYDWVMGVCLGGVINGMVTFVPRMIKAGKGGHIATTSSWGGFMGFANDAPYAAAKAAVNSLMESYYQALKPYGIGLSVLCPTNMRSDVAEAINTRPKHMEATGYKADEEIINSLRTTHIQGMDPVELAGWLKRGIENEQLYILPFPNAEQMLRDNFQRVLDYSTPEGTRHQDEIAEVKRILAPVSARDI